MTFDLSLFSLKLKKYREQFKTPLIQMSLETGIPEESLRQLEHAERRPTGDEVLILAARQAFLTDDQGARELAEETMDKTMVQTVPHLLGWLCFENYLSDGDVETVIKEHKEFERPLERFFREIYRRALQYRSIAG